MRGFIQIQNLLERAIVKTVNESVAIGRQSVNGTIQKFPAVYLQQFPYPKYKAEEYKKILTTTTPKLDFTMQSQVLAQFNFPVIPMANSQLFSVYFEFKKVFTKNFHFSSK
jgi:hypothetical protein